MRKNLIIVFALFCVLAVNAQEFKHVIKVSPFGLLFGQISGTYEKVLTENSSFLVNLNYLNRDFLGVKTKSFGAGIGYRHYLQHDKLAPIGFYLSPEASYSNFSIDQDVINASSFGVGVVGGYQWVWSSGFSLDLNIGAQYAFSNNTNVNNVNLGSFNGIVPKLGVNIGWGF